MSYREGHHFQTADLQEFNQQGFKAFKDFDFSNYTSIEELRALWRKTLESGVHGLCFSMYEDGQQPGDTITEAQVDRRIQIIKPYVKWVRSFSCIEGNEHVPVIAKKHGIKTMVGAWLGDDKEKNELEIEALIQLAKDGFVDIAAVGNEVMYRGDLTEDELIAHIKTVRDALPESIPVAYVDAYYEFSVRPRITEVCDVILTNCYPYWEGCPQEYSLNHMQQMYGQAMDAGAGKKVIITETGWPNKGEGLKGAIPSEEAAIKYFINAILWAKQSNIEIFYFSSFDESWKVGPEGDVGAHWGLWDKHENLKF